MIMKNKIKQTELRLAIVCMLIMVSGLLMSSGPRTAGAPKSTGALSSRVASMTSSAKQGANKAINGIIDTPGYLAKVAIGKNEAGDYTYDGKFITGKTGSLRSATGYDTYRWSNPEAVEGGWNFTTLANKNYKKPISTDMQKEGLSFNENGMPIYKSTAKSGDSSIMNQQIGSSESASIVVDNSPTITNPTNPRTTNIPQVKDQLIGNTFDNFDSPAETKIPAGTDPFAPIASNTSTMPQQNSINNKGNLDYAAALETGGNLRSFFAQPEITIPVVEVPLSQEAQNYQKNNSRNQTSISNLKTAARNQKKANKKWDTKSVETEQPAPVEQKLTPTPKAIKSSSTEKALQESAQEIVNQPEIQQTQIEPIQLQKKQIMSGKERAQAKLRGQARLDKISNKKLTEQENQTQATNPVDDNFNHEQIYLNKAKAKIPYSTKDYIGNEHLKNYGKNSKTKIANQKAIKDAATIHDIDVEYDNIYGDSKNPQVTQSNNFLMNIGRTKMSPQKQLSKNINAQNAKDVTENYQPTRNNLDHIQTNTPVQLEVNQDNASQVYQGQNKKLNARTGSQSPNTVATRSFLDDPNFQKKTSLFKNTQATSQLDPVTLQS